MTSIGATRKFKCRNNIMLLIIVSILLFSGINLADIDNVNSSSDTKIEQALSVLNDNTKTITTTTEIEFELFFSSSELKLETFGNYDIIQLTGTSLSDEIGEPALPIKIVSVVLPSAVSLKDLEISVEILTEEHLEGEYNIVPAQEPRPISEYERAETVADEHKQAEEFEIDHDLYENSNFYPQNIVQVLPETNLNGINLGHMNVYPIRYWSNNGLVTLFSQMHVSIALPEGKVAHRTTIETEMYDELLHMMVANPDDIDQFYITYTAQTSHYSRSGSNSAVPLASKSNLNSDDVQYVIITNSTNYYSNFYPLAEWKNKKGVPSKIIDDGWIKNKYTGNNTPEKIRNFIKDAKASWGTKWILLGGDISVIPYRGAYGSCGGVADNKIPTDLYYSDLDGNWDADKDKIYGETNDGVNLYPDVYVGRAPVQSTSEVNNFVSKTLKYERNASSGFQLEMLFMAEKLDSNTDAGISKDLIGKNYVPSRFNITKLYQTKNNLTKSNALIEMSRGKGITNHAGHCNYYVMSIGSSKLYRSDVDTLSNKNKQGILYTIGCITTAFENNDCIAEHFVKNTKGGTVAFVGNSRYGWYTPNNPKAGPSNYYDQEFFNQLLQKDVYHIGETVAKHKIKYISWSSSNGAYRWIQYCLNLLGDPELPLWTDVPKDFLVTHPDEVYFGPQTVTIQVNDSVTKNPMPNALVCLQGEDVYSYGLTDLNGNVSFNINPTSNKAINVTVTRMNYNPYEGEIGKIINDTNPPSMILNSGEYGWYNQDPGNVINVDFDSEGETDLSSAQYAASPAGPWYTIFDTPSAKFKRNWNISGIWESLNEGYNKVCIRCFDSAKPNHWTMNNITIKKDTLSPKVTVNDNNYGWFTADPAAIIDVDFSNETTTGILSGTNSPLDRAEYSIGTASGIWYTIFDSQLAEFNINWGVNWNKLVDGTNTIYIRLFDEAGNEDNTTDTVFIKRDTLPPKVVIRKATYGWYSNNPGDVIDVDFSNGGNGSNLAYAQYKLGEMGTWTNISTENSSKYLSNWNIDWEQLFEGENMVHVRCFDRVGFEDATEDNITIFKDSYAPGIKVNKPVYGWYRTNPGNVVDVDFINPMENSSKLAFARYKVHPLPSEGSVGPWRNIFNTKVVEYTLNWSVVWSDLGQGNNSLEIQVFDEASNKNVTVETVYILKDIEPPSIELNSFQYGWYNSDPGSVIDIDFSNNNKGSELSFAEYRIVNVNDDWIKIADINKANFTEEWMVAWDKLADGENQIEVRLWDVAGFYSTNNFTILKDTTMPEIKINDNEYGWYSDEPGSIIDVDFSSGNGDMIKCSGLDFAQYKIGSEGSWQDIFVNDCWDLTTDWSVNWSLLKEGSNIIYLRTCDLAGNVYESEKTIIIKKDTKLPYIDISKDRYGWFGKESDLGEIIDVDFYNLPDINDIPGSDPSLHSNLSKAQYMVEGTDIWIDIFNTNTKLYTDDWNISWSLLEQGENVVFIRLTDEAGNVFYDTTVNISVYKDTIAPSILINQNEYGWYNSDPGSVIDVDFLAGDPEYNSPLMNAQYKFGVYGTWMNIFNEPGEIHNYSEPWSIFWTNLKEGLNSIFLRVYDSAGNENLKIEEIIFKRDTIGPEPPVMVSPVNTGQTIESKPIHYWLEPKDPGSSRIGQYNIQVSLDDSFSTNIVDAATSKLVYSHSTELDTGMYYWRVRAVDIVGNIGDWSVSWNFQITSIKMPDANLPPTANAGDDKVVFVNEEVYFNGSGSSDPENDDLTYLWYLDDDSEVDKVGLAVKWSYPGNGTNIVTLEVFDSYGGSDTDSINVVVLDVEVDSDDDGMSDDWEVYYGLDPNDPKDAMEDTDNDGYVNSMEFVQGSGPKDLFSTPITAHDKTPPKIKHAKVLKGQQLTAITITATVVDEDSGIKEVNLYYKKKTDLNYNSVLMSGDDTYTATIPGSMVTIDDLEYYIEAVDNSKTRNVAYFGNHGQTLIRPSQTNDIDVDVKENIINIKETDMVEDFKDMFAFQSLEICFIVLIIFIILLSTFGFATSRAVRAKQVAEVYEKRRVIKVVRGKDMVWEGIELEKISEDEDMNLLDDDSELDEV